jgi:hypothetical protein
LSANQYATTIDSAILPNRSLAVPTEMVNEAYIQQCMALKEKELYNSETAYKYAYIYIYTTYKYAYVYIFIHLVYIFIHIYHDIVDILQ